jgi:cysteine desulfurase
MSSHKIHGPKGAGALFVREGTPLKPLIFGGGQERNLRSGTENVAGIHGFGIAAQLCKNTMKETNTNLYYLRQRLVQGITGISPDAVLNGAGPDGSSPHIVNFSFPGFRGETIVHGLEQRGVLVSTGSACSSRKKEPSPVLLAMGKTKSEAWSAIRFSMSRFSTKADVDTTILALEDCLEELKPWRKKTI